MVHQREKTSGKRFSSHVTFVSITMLLTLLVYSNSFKGEPQFDDKMVFTEQLLQSPYNFINLNLWEAFKGGMRPVTAFTFSLNHYLFGKETLSFHIINLLIHIANGILVYLFIYMTLTLFSKSPLLPHLHRVQCKEDFVRERWIAFLTSLLFSIHPIQIESVSYIYQRSESLSSFFYLASLISFIFAVKHLETSEPNGPKQRTVISIILYIMFVIGFVIALGSKEIAATLPATAFLYGIFFFEKKGLWKKVSVPFLLIIAGLLVAAVRLSILRDNQTAGYSFKDFTAWEYLLTQFSVIVNYLRLLLFPVGQNIDHGYRITKSIVEARTIASIGLLSSILIISGFLYKRWRAGSFFILWFFLLLLPSSSILPLRDLLVEHRLYLPSIGVFFIIASGVVKLFHMLQERLNKRSAFSVILSAIVLIAVILFAATYNRNILWNSAISLWKDSVSKSSRNARGHYNLGVSYTDKGMTDKSIEQYQITLRLKPDYTDAYINLGVAYTDKGLYDKAIELYKAFLRLRPKDAQAHNNLGNCYLVLGDYRNALKEYIKTLTVKPDNFEAYYNAGLSLKSLGKDDLAKDFFVVFVKNGPKGYENEIRELTLTYNITEGTSAPEAVPLLKRAEDIAKQTTGD